MTVTYTYSNLLLESGNTLLKEDGDKLRLQRTEIAAVRERGRKKKGKRCLSGLIS